MRNDARLKRHELGFFQLEPKPSPKDLAEYYANTYYQNESAGYRKNYSDLEKEVIDLRIHLRATMARSLLATMSSGKMLDVGCGEGFTLSHFSKLGWEVSGIDFSRVGVEQMNPHCSKFVEQGDVFQALHKLITAEQRYDIVWLGNVLEHVLDPISLLSSLRQIVALNGLLVVTVPNDGSVYHEHLFASENIHRRFWIAAPDHINYFTMESLKRIATATKWVSLAVQGDFPIDWYLANDRSNYVNDSELGPAAHRARLMLERMIGLAGTDAANHFYCSLAAVGFGRNLTMYVTPMSDV